MRSLDTLHYGTALLELAQRGCMHPYILSIGINVLLQVLYGATLATPHLADLLAEKARYGYTDKI